jgi:hypothetical protein
LLWYGVRCIGTTMPDVIERHAPSSAALGSESSYGKRPPRISSRLTLTSFGALLASTEKKLPKG